MEMGMQQYTRANEESGGARKATYTLPVPWPPFPDEELLAKFEESMRGGSKDTRKSYINDVRLFMRWAGSDIRRQHPVARKRVITAWVAHLSSVVPALSKTTINRRLSGVKAFYEWYLWESDMTAGDLDDDELELLNPVSKRHFLKVRSRIFPNPIGDAVLKKLFAGVTNLRDLALFKFLNSSGARLSAALGIRLQDISIKECECDGRRFRVAAVKCVEKCDKEHVVYIDEDALKSLMDYVKKFPVEPDKEIFRTFNGRPLSRRRAEHRLAKWIKKLNLPKFTPHRFRHTFATRMVDNGMLPHTLQKALNHELLTTTMKYFEIRDSTVLEDYVKAAYKVA